MEWFWFVLSGSGMVLRVVLGDSALFWGSGVALEWFWAVLRGSGVVLGWFWVVLAGSGVVLGGSRWFFVVLGSFWVVRSWCWGGSGWF